MASQPADAFAAVAAYHLTCPDKVLFCGKYQCNFCGKSTSENRCKMAICTSPDMFICRDCLDKQNLWNKFVNFLPECELCKISQDPVLPSQLDCCDLCHSRFAVETLLYDNMSLCPCSRRDLHNLDCNLRFVDVRISVHNDRRFFTCCESSRHLNHEKGECSGLPRVPEHYDYF